MIDFLLRKSLRHRALVLAAAIALVSVGTYRVSEMPVDVFPDLSAPRVTIVTEATGLAPLEVEQLVTYPLESAVNGLEGARRVRSASAAGISLIWVEFDWDTTDAVARQRVTERLQSGTETLPPEAEPPVLARSSSVMGELVFFALSGDGVDPMEVLESSTCCVHWYASVRTKKIVAALDEVELRRVAGQQLFASLATRVIAGEIIHR